MTPINYGAAVFARRLFPLAKREGSILTRVLKANAADSIVL